VPADIVLYAPDYATVPVIECSPPSWMVHLLLVEKGFQYEVRWLDFEAGEHRTEAMRALNPRATIPVLTDGGAVVHETFAILTYLEGVRPTPAFLPEPAPARAKALTRFFETAYVKRAGMDVFGALMRGDDPPWGAFDEELARWEAYLGEARFAAGDRIGLADLALFTYVATAVKLGWDLAPRPNLRAHHDVLCARDTVRSTWPKTFEPPI